MFLNVCRLCYMQKDLVWVFGPSVAENTVEMIKTMCGVEISRDDKVTQLICSACYDVTRKMFEFRRKSISTDLYIKFLQNQDEGGTDIKTPPHPLPPNQTSPPTVKAEPKPSFPGKYKKAHPSVKKIILTDPSLRLPSNIQLQYNLSPSVALNHSDVVNYFKTWDPKIIGQKNLQILKCIKLRFSKQYAHLPPPPPAVQTPTATVPKKKVVKPKIDGPSKKKPSSATSKTPVIQSTKSNAKPKPVVLNGISGGSSLLKRKLEMPLPATSDAKKPRYEVESPSVPSVAKAESFADALLAASSSPAEQSIGRSFTKKSTGAKYAVMKAAKVNTSKKGKQQPPPVGQTGDKTVVYNSMLFNCNHCENNFATQRGLSVHMAQMHNTCSVCGKKFSVYAVRVEHEKTCTNNQMAVTPDVDAPIKEETQEQAPPNSLDGIEEGPFELEKVPQIKNPSPVPAQPASISISDDEEEHELLQRTHKLVDSSLVRRFNEHDKDVTILQHIIMQNRKWKKNRKILKETMESYPILYDGVSKAKVFKNLRKELATCNIPIEISQAQKMVLDYGIPKALVPSKNDVWDDLEPQKIKVFVPKCYKPKTSRDDGDEDSSSPRPIFINQIGKQEEPPKILNSLFTGSILNTIPLRLLPPLPVIVSVMSESPQPDVQPASEEVSKPESTQTPNDNPEFAEATTEPATSGGEERELGLPVIESVVTLEPEDSAQDDDNPKPTIRVKPLGQLI